MAAKPAMSIASFILGPRNVARLRAPECNRAYRVRRSFAAGLPSPRPAEPCGPTTPIVMYGRPLWARRIWRRWQVVWSSDVSGLLARSAERWPRWVARIGFRAWGRAVEAR